MGIVKKISFFAFAIFIIASCDNDHDAATPKPLPDSATVAPVESPEVTGDVASTVDKPGVAGVFDVPEMLCFSKIDSAPVKILAAKIAKNFDVLEKEIKSCGAEIDGPPGRINYNNDPGNFKFECLLLVKEFPKKQPQKCKVVVLEATRMLIYNYFGPSDELYKAYEDIRMYCHEYKLEQSGPMREFFITDPSTENDASRMQIRIMLPVAVKK